MRAVAARRNVHDVLPCYESDLGIVKGIPAGAYLLKAIVMSRVHRATTVDDHATEIVSAILWLDAAGRYQVMVHADSRGEAERQCRLFQRLVWTGLDWSGLSNHRTPGFVTSMGRRAGGGARAMKLVALAIALPSALAFAPTGCGPPAPTVWHT